MTGNGEPILWSRQRRWKPGPWLSQQEIAVGGLPGGTTPQQHDV